MAVAVISDPTAGPSGDGGSTVAHRVEVTALSKTFGRTRVLKDVHLAVRPGEVHGLLGQNGSGKSTVIKVLSGLYRPDPGARVLVDGQEVPQPITPTGISRRGLTIVHQTLGLLPGHSVTENIRLGQLRGRGWKRLIDWRHERSRAVETLQSMHADIDPDQLVDHLHMGQRATVAIARALQATVPGEGCIVLDESTQSLPREVLPDFYATVRRLADAGTSVLIVSHRLDEVLQLADRVTVLRDGAVAASALPTAGLSEPELAKVILGRQLVGFVPHGRTATRPAGSEDTDSEDTDSEDTVRLEGVRGSTVAHLDLAIRRGEVVGVTGATESGFEELPYLVAGVRPGKVGGTLVIGSRRVDLAGAGVTDLTEAGVALVPADRANEGVALELTALENLTVPRVRSRARHGLLRRGWQREEFDEACSWLSLTPPDPDLQVASFSGGNQQKLLLAKWLLSRPTLLVLHEPTQAVDVGARADILRAIGRAADEGASVLLSSIETQDLALVCDRVLVMAQGRVLREIRAPMTPDDILHVT